MMFIILWLIGSVGAQEKTLGGRMVKEAEFPYVGVLRGGEYCMVIIVTDTKVVTTGTCLQDKDGKLIDVSIHYVVAGIVKLVKDPSDEKGQKRKLLSCKIHEEFKIEGQLKVNNIGVIEVAEPFTMTLYVNTAPFLSGDKDTVLKTIDDFFSQEGNNCTAVSFGSTTPDEGAPSEKLEDLRAVDLFPMLRGKCVERYPLHEVLSGQEICTSSRTEGDALCKGDAGAPLICNGKVFGMFTTTDLKKCGKPDTAQFYIIVGIFLKYFGLGSSPQILLCPSLMVISLFLPLY